MYARQRHKKIFAGLCPLVAAFSLMACSSDPAKVGAVRRADTLFGNAKKPLPLFRTVSPGVVKSPIREDQATYLNGVYGPVVKLGKSVNSLFHLDMPMCVKEPGTGQPQGTTTSKKGQAFIYETWQAMEDDFTFNANVNGNYGIVAGEARYSVGKSVEKNENTLFVDIEGYTTADKTIWGDLEFTANALGLIKFDNTNNKGADGKIKYWKFLKGCGDGLFVDKRDASIVSALYKKTKTSTTQKNETAAGAKLQLKTPYVGAGGGVDAAQKNKLSELVDNEALSCESRGVATACPGNATLEQATTVLSTLDAAAATNGIADAVTGQGWNVAMGAAFCNDLPDLTPIFNNFVTPLETALKKLYWGRDLIKYIITHGSRFYYKTPPVWVTAIGTYADVPTTNWTVLLTPYDNDFAGWQTQLTTWWNDCRNSLDDRTGYDIDKCTLTGAQQTVLTNINNRITAFNNARPYWINYVQTTTAAGPRKTISDATAAAADTYCKTKVTVTGWKDGTGTTFNWRAPPGNGGIAASQDSRLLANAIALLGVTAPPLIWKDFWIADNPFGCASATGVFKGAVVRNWGTQLQALCRFSYNGRTPQAMNPNTICVPDTIGTLVGAPASLSTVPTFGTFTP